MEPHMHGELDNTNALSILFPGAVPSCPAEKVSLVEQYDQSRRILARMGLPILGDKFSPLSHRLNESGAEELVEAAEEVYLASCARQVIKETARYEEAYVRMVENYGMDDDEHLTRLRARRDAAVATLLKTREKVARTRRMEVLAERTALCLEQPVVEPVRRSGAV